MFVRPIHNFNNRSARGDMPPFTENLELFLDLSSPDTSIVNGNVAQIGDRSGKNRHFVQSTVSLRPEFVVTDPFFGGRPSLRFDGIDDLLTCISSFTTNTTIYVVYQKLGNVANGLLYGEGSDPYNFVLLTSTEFRAAVYTNIPSGLQTTKRIVSLDFPSQSRACSIHIPELSSSAVKNIYINGVNTGSYLSTGLPSGKTKSSGNQRIGNGFGIGTPNAKITDILCYSVEHTEQEIALMDDWLRWRNSYQTKRISDDPPYRHNLQFYGNLNNSNTVISGGFVSRLGDDSGNGRHYTQSIATERPIYNPADPNFGYAPSMTFDGTNDHLFLNPTNMLPAMSAASIYPSIANISASLGSFDHLFSIGVANSTTGALIMFYGNDANLQMNYYNPPVSASGRIILTTLTGAVNRVAAVANVSSGSSLWSTYVTGISGGSNNGSNAFSGGTTATNTSSSIGSNAVGTQNAEFTLGNHFLIFSGAHSQYQVAAIDEWLKYKYNENMPTNVLPSGSFLRWISSTNAVPSLWKDVNRRTTLWQNTASLQPVVEQDSLFGNKYATKFQNAEVSDKYYISNNHITASGTQFTIAFASYLQNKDYVQVLFDSGLDLLTRAFSISYDNSIPGFSIGYNNAGAALYNSSVDETLNTPSVFVIICDTSGSSKFTIYRNNQDVTVNAKDAAATGDLTDIGYWAIGNEVIPTGVQSFSGSIPEFVVWRKHLNSTEITQTFNYFNEYYSLNL